MIDITSLEISCEADGNSKVTAWAKCRSAEDIDDICAWLGLARSVMTQWQDIRAQRPKPSSNVTNIKGGKDK